MQILQGNEPADRPLDVVVVLCDDFNPFYTGFGGDPDASTPNLDALARESAVFTRCYATSVVCMSSRTSLVTGLYPHSTGCWGNATDLFVSPRFTTMFTDLKGAGYATAMIGKTHWYAGQGYRDQFASLSDYMEGIGIDFFREVATTFASRGGKGNYQDFLRSIGKFEAQSKDLTERLSTNQYLARPSLLEPEETCDWMMTDLALEYLQSTSGAEPFALMIGYSNPHSPFDPAGKYASMYDPESISVRENVVPFRKYGDDYSLAKIREARAAYLGKISFLDALLGRLVTGLQERGTWDRTILVFTADHGMAVGEHGNIAKGQFWEEVARVPMVMRVPGLTDEGLVSD
ncbi:MAG: sulfatase-like hydrolase/transferase, partial [Verrucomicrobiota bacterium]